MDNVRDGRELADWVFLPDDEIVLADSLTGTEVADCLSAPVSIHEVSQQPCGFKFASYPPMRSRVVTEVTHVLASDTLSLQAVPANMDLPVESMSSQSVQP